MRDWLAAIWWRLRGTLSRRRVEHEMEEEYRFHLAKSIERNLRRGMRPAVARREALLRFGGVESMLEAGREAQRSRVLEGTLQDVKHGARSLLRSPGFTVATVLTLALGIGANTAMFSVVNGVLLKPLPFPDAERIHLIGWAWGGGQPTGATSAYQFAFVREHGTSFDGVMTFRSFEQELGGPDRFELVHGLRVSEDFFRVIGVAPMLGRAFDERERAINGPPVAVLGHGFWLREFGGAPDVVGRAIVLNGEAYAVVGVMPASFAFPPSPANTEVLLPLRLQADPADEGTNWMVVVRRARGVSGSRAAAQVDALSQTFRQQNPQLGGAGTGLHLMSYSDVFAGGLQTILWVLLGAVGFVLLIACANAANLLLVRAMARQQEAAVRAAIGAGRWRILRPLLCESALLSAAAGALGVVTALVSVDAMLALAPADLPRASEIGLDLRVLGFAVLVSCVTGVLFGMAGALPGSRPQLARILSRSGRGNSPAKRRTRDVLVVCETALAVVLLAGAGLLMQSFANLRAVDPGFETSGVVAVRPGRLPSEYFDNDRVATWERGVLDRMRGVPGVESAAALSSFPFERGLNFPIAVEGRPDTEEGAVELRGVTAGYFATLRVELLRGRSFGVQDGPGSARVALINQAYAQRYFPDTDPVGQRLELGKWRGRWTAPALAGPVEIVGVVADIREIRVGAPARRTVYVPRSQPGGSFSAPQFIVRARPRSDLRDALNGALRADDPRLLEPTIQPLSAIVDSSLATPRFQMLLLTLFAGSAVVLTLIGIYGVVSYTVRQQAREIGIRMALGARANQVVPAIVRRGLSLVAAGAALGTVAALALTRLLSGMLFGVTPTDARTFALVLTVFGISALLASWLPARRATRIAPTASLRAE